MRHFDASGCSGFGALGSILGVAGLHAGARLSASRLCRLQQA